MESHDGSGDSGSKCFNGTQENQAQGDGRDGQCKTVYVVDWLSSTRNQVFSGQCGHFHDTWSMVHVTMQHVSLEQTNVACGMLYN